MCDNLYMKTCVYLKYLLFQLLFVQGTALLMMIELVKSVISHARVIVSDFFFSLNGSFRLSACFFLSFNVCICICEV